MSDHNQVCPWCHTEIVWDEEIGPEPNCPHCFNELGEYRSVSIPLKRNGRGDIFEEEATDEWGMYTEEVRELLDQQEEAPECPLCQEYMVLAGKQTVTEREFTPHIPSPGAIPFLKTPYQTDVFVCSHCFHLQYRISEENRMQIVRTLASRRS